MFHFEYQAKDAAGKLLKGKVEAASPHDASRLLRERGLIVIKISSVQTLPFASLFNGFKNRISLDDVVLFTRQFSTMVSAGLPITEALDIIKTQSRTSMKPVIGQILSDVEGGASLSKALERHPKVFSPVYIALIRAGETGGILDKLIEKLATNLENQQEFQSKVKGALIYPAIVIIGMIVVGIIMMVVVIPKITAFYTDFGAELPFATSALIKTSQLMQGIWWLIPILTVLAIWGFRILAQTKEGRVRLDRFKFKIPIVGELQKQTILAELTRTMGLLVGGGIPILDGLRVVSGVVGNVIVSTAVDRVTLKVEKGFSLAYSFSEEREVFPPFLYQMLAVGEETGKVDETLLRISVVYEKESERAVKNLTSAIEPIIMVVLGVGVGFMVIAIIMPIYNLTSQF